MKPRQIDLNELHSMVHQEQAGTSLLMKVFRYVAWTCTVMIRMKIGIRYFPITYVTTTGIWLVLDSVVKPYYLAPGFEINLIDFSNAFRTHLTFCVIAGIAQAIWAFIREKQGKIQMTLYSGKPLVCYLLDKLPFTISESTVKRFIEPTLVYLSAFLVDDSLPKYQLYLHFAGIAMFVIAHKNFMHVRHLSWNQRDMILMSKALLQKENESDEVFLADEDSTIDATELSDDSFEGSDGEEQTFNA